MAIITISRELAALGDETAHELAKQLNCSFVDRLSLEDRIRSYGVADRKFTKYDERKPSFWSSFSSDRDDYLHFLKTAIFAEAEQGSCIFMGRGAMTILKGVPGVFSVFLAAPMEIRLERVKSYFHCDANRARQIIEKSDQDRNGFHRYFFETDWKDTGNYHLALNTGHLHPEVCAEIIKFMRDRVITDEAETQKAERIAELNLEQKIIYSILYQKEIQISFLEVSVCRDSIHLYGVANSQSLVEAGLNAARELVPNAAIQSEIQVVHEYTTIPKDMVSFT
jgi:cytidylate kinase